MMEALGFLMIALSWLAPNHYPPWWSFYSDATAAVGLAMLWIALGTSGFKVLRLPVPTSALVLALVAAVPAVQFAMGQLHYATDAVVPALYLCTWSAAVIVGHAGARLRGAASLHMLSITVLFGAVVSALLALAQSLQVAALGYWALEISAGDRAGANLGQANNLATLLVWGLLSLWHLHECGRLSRWTAALLCATLVVGLATTQSRTALLYGPAVLWGLWLARRRGLALKTSLRTAGGVVLLSGLVSAIWPYALDAALVTGDLSSLASRGIGSQRWPMWQLLFDAVKDKPWTGYGWLQVGEAQLAVADVRPPVDELWMHGHNLFLELVVWCGFPLGLLLSGAVLYWWARRAGSVSSLPAVVSFLALTCFGIHAMLELPHHFLYFLVPVGLYMGQVEAERSETSGAKPSASFPGLALTIAACALVFGVLTAKDYLEVEEDFRLMRFEAMGVRGVEEDRAGPDAPFLSSLTSYLSFARQVERAGMSEVELSAWSQAVSRYPQPSALAKLARACAMNGRLAEARALMMKLRHTQGEREYERQVSHIDTLIASGWSALEPLRRQLPGRPSKRSAP